MSSRKLFVLLVAVGATLYGAYENYVVAPSIPSAVVQSSGQLPTSAKPVTLLKNRAYEVGYSEIMKDPRWVHYALSEANRSPKQMRRPKGGFDPDPRTRASITTRDYADTGFDRGHMAPSYAIGQFHGHSAQVETFVMSNVVPQTHFCNDGVWNSIERMEADDFAKRFGVINVVDGPVFDTSAKRFPSGVAIPSAFYKAIRRPDGHVIAFIVPQNPQSPRPEEYLSSINEIERRTGIDPFPGMSPAIKEQRRSKIW
jgi:endonuclease G, mitochondrial